MFQKTKKYVPALALILAAAVLFSAQANAASGAISASPNPCEVLSGSNNLCTGQINWSTTGITVARVYVIDAADGIEKLFAESASGLARAPWIQPSPHSYAFSLYDYSSGGRGSKLAEVVVTAMVFQPTTVTLTANPLSVSSGGSAVMSWSRSPDLSCRSASVPPNPQWNYGYSDSSTGSVAVTNLTQTTEFRLNCTVSNTGLSIPASATVVVGGISGSAGPASVDLSIVPTGVIPLDPADPRGIPPGGFVQLNWTSSGVSSCTAASSPTTSDWSGSKSTSGSQIIGNVNPDQTQNATFRIVCQVSGSGAVSDEVAIPVVVGAVPNGNIVDPAIPSISSVYWTRYPSGERVDDLRPGDSLLLHFSPTLPGGTFTYRGRNTGASVSTVFGGGCPISTQFGTGGSLANGAPIIIGSNGDPFSGCRSGRIALSAATVAYTMSWGSGTESFIGQTTNPSYSFNYTASAGTIQPSSAGLIASPNPLEFQVVQGQSGSETKTVTVRNSSQVQLIWQSATVSGAPFSWTPNQGTLAPGASATINVTLYRESISGRALGTYPFTITMTSPAGSSDELVRVSVSTAVTQPIGTISPTVTTADRQRTISQLLAPLTDPALRSQFNDLISWLINNYPDLLDQMIGGSAQPATPAPLSSAISPISPSRSLLIGNTSTTTAAIQNLTDSSRGTNFYYTDRFRITVAGAPLSPVYFRWTKNGSSWSPPSGWTSPDGIWWTNPGSLTDQNGSFINENTWGDASVVGSWTAAFKVNSLVSNTLNYTVGSPPSANSQFIVGGRVQVSSGPLNVRDGPSLGGSVLGGEPTGALGTVIGGPVSADGYAWWQINWDNGLGGWSAGNYLSRVSSGGGTPLLSSSESQIIAQMRQARTIDEKVRIAQNAGLFVDYSWPGGGGERGGPKIALVRSPATGAVLAALSENKAVAVLTLSGTPLPRGATCAISGSPGGIPVMIWQDGKIWGIDGDYKINVYYQTSGDLGSVTRQAVNLAKGAYDAVPGGPQSTGDGAKNNINIVWVDTIASNPNAYGQNLCESYEQPDGSYVNSCTISLNLTVITARVPYVLTDANKLGQLIEHEMGHSFGFDHPPLGSLEDRLSFMQQYTELEFGVQAIQEVAPEMASALANLKNGAAILVDEDSCISACGPNKILTIGTDGLISCSQLACPLPGQAFDYISGVNRCAPINCPSGSILDPSSGLCIANRCQPGQHISLSGTCEAGCTAGSFYDPFYGGCVPTPTFCANDTHLNPSLRCSYSDGTECNCSHSPPTCYRGDSPVPPPFGACGDTAGRSAFGYNSCPDVLTCASNFYNWVMSICTQTQLEHGTCGGGSGSDSGGGWWGNAWSGLYGALRPLLLP